MYKLRTAFILILCFLSLCSMAKELADGYIILANQDTIRCQIKVPKSFALFSQVTIVDSLNNEISYKASKQEITGFGFFYKKHQYDYTLKTDETKTPVFYQVVEKGKEFNLYYCYDFTGSGSGASYRTDYYVIEDSAGKSQALHGGLGSGFRKKLIAFLNGDKTLLRLYDKKIYSIADMPAFVEAANAR